MALPVTALYAALLGLLYGVLTLLVVRARFGSGVMLGMGEDRRLHRAVRAHANFTEFVPLALLLIALNEGLRVSTFLLHGLGMVLVLARVLHAIGISREPDIRAARGPGAVLTLAVIIVASLTLLSRALAALTILG
ncbi:MAPEG family protein [Belnapia sp. T6]|uniref:MAPEG family protein n=1 Tax=Belnapia mucosa TaxID=2804532 RepID=A0ABS1V9W6_9PROT|nr:MAPEG family protein [Belnapia mucosa]MBL6458469.1 MAPEG family protein [Belnapia mucosa]